MFSPQKYNSTSNKLKQHLHRNVIGVFGFLFLSLVTFVIATTVDAATGINEQISFQGKVVNTNGTNVTNGSYTFLFCLYTTSSPATPCTAGADNDAVWRESKSLTVTDGIFQSNLGDTTTLPGSVDFNTDNIYLGINFNSDGQMTPLVRFTAAPYAMNAAKVGGLTVTDTTGTLTIPNGKTIQFADAFTTTGAFPLTLTSTASTTATLPSGTITLVDLATSQSLTNKTIGSTGLTFSGATTDITTATNEDLTIVANGTGTISLNDTVTAVSTVTLSSVANDGAEATALLINASNQVVSRELGSNAFTSGGFATTALDNLASVAINTSLISDTNNTDDLGSDAIRWKDLFLGPNTLHVGTSTTDEGVLSYNTTSNILNIGTDSTSNGDIAFFTDDLYLDKSTGFVGINDTTPDALLDFDFTSTSGTNGDEYGANFTVSDTGIVNTGTDNTYGQNLSVTRTGATGGTINTYGLNVAVTGDTGGTSTATGIAVTASGADTNTGISVVGAAGTGALITSTTGKGLNITRSLTDTTTSNSLVDIAPSYAYTTGTTTLSSIDFSISRAVNVSGASTTMTDSGSAASILYSPTISSGATTSLSGVVFDVTRSIANFNFSVPVVVSGAVMNVTDTNSADFGTITNTADVLRVSQFNSGTTGATLNIANFSVGPSFRVNDDGTFTDSTPFIVDASGNVGIGNDTTPVAKLTVGASDAFQVASTGGITFNGVTADISTTAGEALTIDSGTTGAINIGTDASAETINIGNTGAAVKTIAIGNNTQANTITIGDASVTGLSLTDNNWSVTAAGVASFIAGTVIGSQTFTTNNIADSGSLTIKSATTNALTLDSGTTGTVNIATGTAGKAINIGTDNTTSDTITIGSLLDNIAITSDSWSITDAGVLTVVSCSGCGGGGSTLDSAYTAGNTIGTDSGSNVIINLADVATPTEVTINNLDASGTNALQIDNSTTLTNGLFIEQSAAGTLTNAINIAGTAGTITNGLLIADGAGAITNGIQLTGTFATTILDTPSIDISGAGAITGATGMTSSGTITFSGLNNAGAVLFTNGSGVLTQDTANLIFDDTNNRLGIGDSTPDAVLDFDFTSTNGTAGTEYGSYFTVSDTGTVGSGGDVTYGNRTSVTRTGATGGQITTYGQYTDVTADNAGAGTSEAYGVYGVSSAADTSTGGKFSAGNSSTLYGIDAETYATAGTVTTATAGKFTVRASVATTTAYGIRSVLVEDFATITTGYGLYIDDIAATTDYGVYQAGSNDVNILFGSTNIGGDLTPNEMFTVGSTSQFQVNSSGAIAAATGVTSSGTITLSAIANDGAEATALLINGSNQVVSRELGSNAFTSTGYATTALDNLASVAINTSLISDTNNTDDLGSDAIRWRDLFLGSNTLHIGTNTTDEGTVSYNTTSNIFNISTDSTSNGDIAFFTDDLYLDKSTGFVGINTITPSSKLDITTASLGVTQTTSSGLALVNTTPAAAGAQQISPAIRWSGQGWETLDPASVAVDFRAFVIPVQGTTFPTGYLTFQSNTTGSYQDRMVITSGGNLGVGDTTPTAMLTVGNGDLFQVASTGGITFNGVTADISTTAGEALTIDSGTTGAINIGTDASAETINIGNTGAAVKTIAIGNNTQANTITIGDASVTGLSLTDNNWSINASGVASFITGSSIGSQTFTTNNIADSGSLTISSATTNALTLDSGTTGTVNLGTGNNAKTINVGTGTAGNAINIGTNNTTLDTINIGSVLDDVAITGDQWSVTNAGVLTVVSCSGCGGGSTLDSAYTSGNTIGTDSGSNVIINLADVATPTEVTINNLDASGTNALQIDNSTTLTNALFIEQSAAGTMTNAINIAGTAGTITTGLLIADGAGAITNGIQLTGTFTTTILDTPSIDISGAGAITGATGVSTTTLTSSSTTDLANAGASNVTIATTGTGTVAIGNATGTFALTSSGGLNVTTGGALTGVASIDTIAVSATAITFAGTGTIASTTTGLTLDSGSNTLTVAATDTTLTASGITTLTLGTNTTIASAGTITLDSASSTIIPDADTFQTNDVTSAGALTISSASGANNLTLDSGTTGSILIGTGVAAKTITIGNATDDTFSLNSSGLNVTSGGALTGVASIDTIAVSATALTFAGAGTIASTTASALTLDSGTTGTVNLGTGNNAKTIAIGTGTAGNIINIGTNNAVSDTIAIGSALDNIAITSDSWSVTDAGVLTVVSCSGCGGGGTVWSGIGAPTGALSLSFDATETSSFAFNGYTTETGFSLSSDAGITSGELMDLTVSAASGFTGNVLDIGLSDGTGATSNTGNLLKITNAGTANANTSLLVNHYATGTGNLAFRVDDVSGDTTPFVIDGAGSVGIGTAAPSSMLDIFGTSNMVRLSYDVSNYVTLASDSAGNLLVNSSSSSQNVVLVGDGTATDSSVQFDGVTNDYYVGEDATDGFFHIGKGAVLGTTVFITADSTGQVGIGDTTPNALFTVGTTSQFQVNSSGAIAATTGVTSSGTIAANGGITFDASTDTVGAHTMGGDVIGGGFIITDIGNTGTDFVASTGALTLAGVLTANGGITLAGSQSFAASALSYMDLGAVVHNTTANQGLRLPNAASATPSNPTSGEGYLAWDAAGNQLITYNGSAWATLAGGYNLIKDESTGLTARTTLAFLGAGVSCADNASQTECTISGGAGSDLQGTYGTDADGSNATISLTSADDSLVFSNPASSGTDSTFTVKVEQLNTGIANDALYVDNRGTGNGFRVDDSSGDTTPFIIDGDGNVGIGTTSFGMNGTITPALQIGSATNRQNVDVYGGSTNKGYKKALGVTNIIDMFIYDTTKDSDAGRWREADNTSFKSWYTETKDDGPGDACVASSDDRCGTATFPAKALLVTTADSLYIFDTRDNTLWMKFSQNASGYALGVDTNNDPSGVFGINGTIYVGTKGTSATGLYAFDFHNDRLYNYDATDRSQGDKNIANRNTAVSFATNNQTYFAIANSVVNDVHGAVISRSGAVAANYGTTTGKTFIVAGTDSGASLIDLTGSKVFDYADTATDDVNQVWLTSRARLYLTNETLSQVELYTAVDQDVADQATPDDIYDEQTGNTPSLAKTAPTMSTSPDALQVLEGESAADANYALALGTVSTLPLGDVLYVGHSLGLTEIHTAGAPSTAIIGWSKFYSTTTETAYMSGTPRGMFTMDGASGDVTDATIRNSILDAKNTPTYGVNGVRGLGMSFNGTNQYLCSDADNNAACDQDTDFDAGVLGFTIEAWFKKSAIAGTDTLIDHSYTTTPGVAAGWRIWMNSSGQMQAGIDDDAVAFDDDVIAGAGPSLADGQWHHVVFTRASTAFSAPNPPVAAGIYLYVDGKLVGSDTTIAATATLTAATILAIGADCSVGAACATGANFWDGQIDDVYISMNGATTSDTLNSAGGAIARRYTEGKTALLRPSTQIIDATTVSASTIGDSGAAYVGNEFVGQIIEITGGTGAGQTRKIVSNTTTTFTVSPDWTTTPDTTSDYEVMPEQLYGGTNVVTSVGITDTDPLGTTRTLYVGTSDGSDGGGVSVLSGYGTPSVSAVYHAGAAYFDDASTEWTGTDYDDIQSIDVRGGVLALGSTGNSWTSRSDRVLEQSIDQLINNVTTIRNELMADTLQTSAINAGGADLAEWYYSNEFLEAGFIVSSDVSLEAGVKKTRSRYQSDVVGVVATQPGIILGSTAENAYPVALVGRVPVKVSTENGWPIAGDRVTTASVSGYGMRATQAGRVIGVVIEDPQQGTFETCPGDSEEYRTRLCGTVNIFVNLSDYYGQPVELAMSRMNSESTTDQAVNDGLETDSSDEALTTVGATIRLATAEPTREERILAYLKQIRDADAIAGNVSSEVFTGRVSASTEVITPTLYADQIFAKSIRADSIEGLSIWTDQISSLSEKYAGLASAQTATGVDGTSAPTELVEQKTLAIAMKSLSADTITVQLDGSILGRLTVAGALRIGGDAEFAGNAIFTKLATFLDKTLFKGDVVFERAPTFGSNTAGFAVIAEGQQTVDVVFDEAYTHQPIVSVSITSDESVLAGDAQKDTELAADVEAVEADYAATYFDEDVKYIVTKKSARGFTIVLNKSAPRELQFSWVAIAVTDAKVSRSEEVIPVGEPIVESIIADELPSTPPSPTTPLPPVSEETPSAVLGETAPTEGVAEPPVVTEPASDTPESTPPPTI